MLSESSTEVQAIDNEKKVNKKSPIGSYFKGTNWLDLVAPTPGAECLTTFAVGAYSPR